MEELEQKLQEAEEKNQRAISMAQQTKRGHVYIVSNVGSFGDDVFKIGLTRRLVPTDRVRELGDASVPFEFDIHAMMFSDDAPALESELHNVFRDNQVNLVNPRKEFFRTKLTDIKNTVDEMGIEAKWTLVAEAHEYRETLAVQKSQGRKVRDLPPPDPQYPEPRTAATKSVSPSTQIPERRATEPEQRGPQIESQSHGTQESVGLGEQESSQASAPEHTKKKTAPRPSCNSPLIISTRQAGRNTCPHCNKNFKVKR